MIFAVMWVELEDEGRRPDCAGLQVGEA
jgi:hypothetical protein